MINIQQLTGHLFMQQQDHNHQNYIHLFEIFVEQIYKNNYLCDDQVQKKTITFLK